MEAGTYDGVLWGDGAFTAEPLALRYVRDAVAIWRGQFKATVWAYRRFLRTLMHGEVTAIAEDDGVRVLSLRVIADSARRVFGGHSKIRLREILCLQH
jgi:hypothetical protein